MMPDHLWGAAGQGCRRSPARGASGRQYSDGVTELPGRTAPAVQAAVAAMQASFGRFAKEHAHLPLYRAICLGVAADPQTAALLLEAQSGQARPVLWLAAVHELVLRLPEVPAARWYPSVVGDDAVPEGDPWPDVRRTVLEHEGELREVIGTRSTQTNEVNRVVYLAAALALATADVPHVPVVLVELGASAGLLLGLDRYRIELSSPDSVLVLGDQASPVRCAGVDRSAPALRSGSLPPLVARGGLDLHPVHLDDADRVRWLEACLWPDVPGRVERFRAAREILRRDPAYVRTGDLVDDLPALIQDLVAGSRSTAPHVVAFNSWALTYVERGRRPKVARVLEAMAQGGMPVSWLCAEPPGCVPGIPIPGGMVDGGSGTVLGARRWRDGRELAPVAWGTCHPHGEWIDLTQA